MEGDAIVTDVVAGEGKVGGGGGGGKVVGVQVGEGEVGRSEYSRIDKRPVCCCCCCCCCLPLSAAIIDIIVPPPLPLSNEEDLIACSIQLNFIQVFFFVCRVDVVVQFVVVVDC